ncbi:UNVERIFIED_ORG: hypothetical protein BDU10_9599 [Burkholderia sp. CF145]|nr:hypothetical protein PMI06_008546 [Burkholderia sp. BT03]SKC49278.1 hypothetical protein SAMN06266956_0268 [Paraburkholderia hospita]
MKMAWNEQDRQFRKLIKRAVIAYSGALGIVALALVISIVHGAGWKPASAGMPLYVTLFVGITYQLVRELRAPKRKEQKDDV